MCDLGKMVYTSDYQNSPIHVRREDNFPKKKSSFLPCKEFLQCSDGNSSHFHTLGKEIRWVIPLKYIDPLAIERGIKEGRKPKLNIINSLMWTTFNMMVCRTPYFLEKLSSNLF